MNTQNGQRQIARRTLFSTVLQNVNFMVHANDRPWVLIYGLGALRTATCKRLGKSFGNGLQLQSDQHN